MNNSVEENVVKFIKKHHVMAIATLSEEGLPRTANLFYVYDKENASFIFTSSLLTNHGLDMERDERVGANVVLETSNIGQIEGLQIEGRANRVTKEEFSSARRKYIRKFPYAIVVDLELWILKADFLKMTNNKLGFGKKIIWKRIQNI